jgi:mono/diheme cytochrome c family protein
MTHRRVHIAGVTVTFVLAAALTACGGEPTDRPAAEPAGPPSTKVTAALLERGTEIYKANCVPCHGPTGKGDGPSAAALDPKPRDHTNRAYMDTLKDEQIAATIVQGGAPKYPNMPSHPHLRGEDLVAIVAKVRTLSRGSDQVSSVDLVAQ